MRTFFFQFFNNNKKTLNIEHVSIERFVLAFTHFIAGKVAFSIGNAGKAGKAGRGSFVRLYKGTGIIRYDVVLGGMEVNYDCVFSVFVLIYFLFLL